MISDQLAFVVLVGGYFFLNVFLMTIVHFCKKTKADDEFSKDRFMFAEYMGRMREYNVGVAG